MGLRPGNIPVKISFFDRYPSAVPGGSSDPRPNAAGDGVSGTEEPYTGLELEHNVP